MKIKSSTETVSQTFERLTYRIVVPMFIPLSVLMMCVAIFQIIDTGLSFDAIYFLFGSVVSGFAGFTYRLKMKEAGNKKDSSVDRSIK